MTLAVETTLVAGAAVVGGAATALLVATAAVVWAGAEATQLQTAAAEDCTARPVTAPHPETTQLSAALAIAADWEALHWHAKSCEPQPTPEAAELIQETWSCQQTCVGAWISVDLRHTMGPWPRQLRTGPEPW